MFIYIHHNVLYLSTGMLLYVHLFVWIWVYNVNVLHVVIEIVVYLLHLYRSLINASLKTGTCWSAKLLSRKLFEVIAASGQRFSIMQVISHIADGSTELQKSPNKVEVHCLAHDENFFQW